MATIPPRNGTLPSPLGPVVHGATATVSTIQAFVEEAAGGVRERVADLAIQVGGRTEEAVDLARRLAYASVGVLVVAQEELTARFGRS